jgi:hypothetical protein
MEIKIKKKKIKKKLNKNKNILSTVSRECGSRKNFIA